MKALKSIETFFNKAPLVIFFVLISFIVYEQGLKKRNKDLQELQSQLIDLEREKELLIAEQEDLKLQINSQSDPYWIELTLIKELGLVPEGYTKILINSR